MLCVEHMSCMMCLGVDKIVIVSDDGLGNYRGIHCGVSPSSLDAHVLTASTNVVSIASYVDVLDA